MKKILKQLIREELGHIRDEILKSICQKHEESRYLTRKQVAQYLNIGLSTVDLWSRLGKLTKIQIDGSVRFDREMIDQVLAMKNRT